MDNFSGIQFQELKFLNELLDQVIILDQKKTFAVLILVLKKDLDLIWKVKIFLVWFETINSLKQLIKPSRLIKLTL